MYLNQITKNLNNYYYQFTYYLPQRHGAKHRKHLRATILIRIFWPIIVSFGLFF